MDVHTPKQRSANMAAIRPKDTRPEMIVRRMVHAMGYRYVLHGRRLPGRPDLVFPSRRLAMFVHGCFWHMHHCRWGSVIPATRREFWQTKRSGNVKRDQDVVAMLRAQGWQVVVVWECETRDREKLAERLSRLLHESKLLSSVSR